MAKIEVSDESVLGLPVTDIEHVVKEINDMRRVHEIMEHYKTLVKISMNRKTSHGDRHAVR